MPDTTGLAGCIYMTAKKGQIEAIVFSVIFLLIAVAVIIAGIIALVGVRGGALSRSVEIMKGASRPVTFSSGLVLLEPIENVSVLEQALQIAVTGRMPALYGRTDLLPLAGRVQRAIGDAGFEKDWRLIISNRTDHDALPIFELGKFPTFCGALPYPLEPQRFENDWAWCEEGGCSPGRMLYEAGQGRCRQSQACCEIFGYNFTKGAQAYVAPIKDERTGEELTACGPDEDGWSGICRRACVLGEVETANSSQCPRKNPFCCRPAERWEAFEPTALDAIMIPLLYADADRAVVGKLEIWLGEPE